MARTKGGAGNPQIVLDTLRALGPLTNRELVEETGIPQRVMNTVLYKLKQKPNRLIHIAAYVDQPCNGHNTRPHAAYAIGDKKDATKPKPLGRLFIQNRLRQQRNSRVTSIFNIGANNMKALFTKELT
jgi:hypothetical protein